MIISRTPLRVPLGGGGTDLVTYSSKHGGFILSAAVNKYIYVTVNRRFEKSIRISYSKTEIVDAVNEIEHPIVREALKLLGLGEHIEITTVADAPSGSGLGTSGSFAVGLLNALHLFKKEKVTDKVLAEEACKIEIDILKEPIGKHDQYLAAFGGITCLDIARDGSVKEYPLKINSETVGELEHRLVFFYTGMQRKAGEILKEQSSSAGKDEEKALTALHNIKQIGLEIKDKLEKSELDDFGKLLDEHWKVKKSLSGKISAANIDRWYETALKNGATGGKIMGAGGGGFFMFYCPGNKEKLRGVMKENGLEEIRFSFEPEGSKIILNI